MLNINSVSSDKQTWTRHFLLFILMISAGLSLTSCEDEEDIYLRETLPGEWRVVEVSSVYGSPGYTYHDTFIFGWDNSFKCYDDLGRLVDYGDYSCYNSIISIYYPVDGQSARKITCSVVQYDDIYMVLNVSDEGNFYRLRLVRLS